MESWPWPRPKEDALDFIAKNILIEGECHIWQRQFSNPTPFIYMGSEDRHRAGVHRVIWQAHHGAVSAHTVIKQLCGNARCVNPAHLVAEPQGFPQNTSYVVYEQAMLSYVGGKTFLEIAAEMRLTPQTIEALVEGKAGLRHWKRFVKEHPYAQNS